MKAIILAAGEGLRCRPLTLTRSKVMLPIANRPILEHVIDSLEKNGINEIILVVGYEKERIMDYFQDGLNFGVKIKYVEQKAQLGTAHAIEQAKKLIDPDDSGFLVLNGDNLVEPKTIADLLNNYDGGCEPSNSKDGRYCRLRCGVERKGKGYKDSGKTTW